MDGKPESDQNGDGHQEGHARDAVSQGVDDLHRGEVRSLGSVEMGKVSETVPLGSGRLDH